jgi:hypothetical protein
MSRPAGLVPVTYHIVGKFLVGISGVSLVVLLISKISNWFSLPLVVPVVSIAALIVGLYLIFIIPRESI